jgi:hypothetical protein
MLIEKDIPLFVLFFYVPMSIIFNLKYIAEFFVWNYLLTTWQLLDDLNFKSKI